MKKSQTTSKSSAKTAKLPAKKTAETSLKTAKKTLKKPSQSKTEKKKGVGGKASASLSKALAKAKITPVAPAKASAKKSVSGKTTKKVKKPEGKKPLKSVKETSAKLSRSKAKKVKPVEVPSVAKAKKLPIAPAIKKTAANIYPEKKPVKSSEKITKTKKVSVKETAKTINAGKSLTTGEKPEKKSLAKTVAPITKITQKTTVKSMGTKKPSAEKAKKVVPGKPKEKAVKHKKIAASAEGGAKTEKRIPEKLKLASGKKPLIAKTVPQIKVPAKQKGTLKPIEQKGASPSSRRKTVKKKGTSSLVATESLLETSKKTAATYAASSIAPSQAETKQNKSAQLKIFLPEETLPPEEPQITPPPVLPEEYGENELILMEVDPAIVFVSWEIKPDCISCKTGKLTLRVYDVTGLDFDGSNANKFFDITLSKRVDSKFIDIKMPGRDVIMEIGLLLPEGPFDPIKRSNRVSMPALRAFEEPGITGSLPGSNTLIGY
jgi:hypothetical protein